jgi:hypothetical protein
MRDRLYDTASRLTEASIDLKTLARDAPALIGRFDADAIGSDQPGERVRDCRVGRQRRRAARPSA